MNIKKNIENGVCIFSLKGKFVFSDNQAFKGVVDVVKSSEFPSVILDLSELEFVDSAALGMFLVIRDEAKKRSVNLSLSNPVGHVQKMFTLSNFSSLFNII